MIFTIIIIFTIIAINKIINDNAIIIIIVFSININ